MNSTSTYAGERLVIHRTLNAPLERVWRAFTDSHESRKWHAPEGMHIDSYDADLRVGGTYRLAMRREDNGEAYVAKGTYREIVPNVRVSYTWTWEEDAPEDEHETLVTWEFRAAGNRTELTLTQVGLASVESRDAHAVGWAAMLDSLERAVATA
jgi:uncharacterized protein YndB with AHSA1/START domain